MGLKFGGFKGGFCLFESMHPAVSFFSCKSMYRSRERDADAGRCHPGVVAEVAAVPATGVGQLPPLLPTAGLG